jgi:hypothetical protein
MQQERQELDGERQNLAQVTCDIEQKNNDLKIREARLVDIEPLVPTIKEFMNVGITFQLIVPYVMAIHEKSALEYIDLKTAAYSIADEIKSHRDLETLNRHIAEKRKELASMRIITE